MNDQEKLNILSRDESYFTKVYDEHKAYTIRFLNKMNSDYDLISDLYQDAMILLYQKSKDPSFKLTCSIQTYINSVCRNQLLNNFRQNSKFITKEQDFNSSITDWFEDDFDIEKEKRLKIIENALLQLKKSGEKCFEIIKRFFYEKQSMDEIAQALNYSNGDNVKNQKSRCQKKLKELVFQDYESSGL